MSDDIKKIQIDFDSLLESSQSSLPVNVVGEPYTVEAPMGGNINYVFRIRFYNISKTLIVKHAEKTARISNSFRLDVKRGMREAAVLDYYNSFLPGIAPKVYYYDNISNSIIMEDLYEYIPFREYLKKGIPFHCFSEKISDFLAKSLYYLSSFSLEQNEKKQMTDCFQNTDLCNLTKQLVFSEPYFLAENNSISKDLYVIAQELLFQNQKLIDEVKSLENSFFGKKEALIHGDLHFDSIFVSLNDIKIVDPEFAFFGPFAYDIGNILAHFILEYVQKSVLAAHKGTYKDTFIEWLAESPKKILRDFREKFIQLVNKQCSKNEFKNESFLNLYLDEMITESIGFAGTECIRRVVGLAKVPEITDEKDSDIRLCIEKEILWIGVKMILSREIDL